jgi:23S rRNA (uracil1939-C5)-methyltransferase
MPFKPTDFTQVNHQINTVLVGRALRLLDVQRHETVIDWFCGLGNFTLPLATLAKSVLGIEGSQTLVDRALANARLNGLDARTRFDARNLFELTADDLVALGTRGQVAGRSPARGRVRAREGAGRAEGGAARGLDGAAAHRLRQLQPGHAGARRGPAGAPRRLPLRGGRAR